MYHRMPPTASAIRLGVQNPPESPGEGVQVILDTSEIVEVKCGHQPLCLLPPYLVPGLAVTAVR